ncbi:hypothetical protein H8N01_13680 [Streptomyces sp. AC536]|uniref:hypothetical protein n=1 Tax=Streptomyces buecherae TaxID=2763006 RepID=UPI00164E03EE|nr:hypothetical protein [Streptomyces buecherae]MBC3983580.1 hypothetical protein [Streptomyces buecherae]QNJ40647.1 hypothetical protein H7H31_12965 [Streptomyces buecherae]
MLLPAGCQRDAVRTSAAIADAAFQILDGTENCAAIIDPRTSSTYWLLPPGETGGFAYWERLGQYVTLLGAGSGTHYVGVPPSHRRTGPGLHWRITGEWSGRYVAQPYYLGAVLTSAVFFAHGPGALPTPCALCERELHPKESVTLTARTTKHNAGAPTTPPTTTPTDATCATPPPSPSTGTSHPQKTSGRPRRRGERRPAGAAACGGGRPPHSCRR